MTKRPRSFIPVVSLLVILTICGIRKHVRGSSFGERSDQMTAFTYVNFIPMTDERVIENQTVLVKGRGTIETDDRY